MNTSATQKRNASPAAASTALEPAVDSMWSNARISAPGFTPSADTAVAALSVNSGLLLYAVSSENQMFELAPKGSSWSALDLSAITETFTQPLSDLTAVSLGVNGKRIYYQSPQNQIHEFVWNAPVDEDWKDNLISGSAAVASNTPLGSLIINSVPHVYYIAPDDHVHELDYQEGKGWINNDLTVQASAPLAQPLSPLKVTTAFNGPYPRVYFLDNANHVCELAWVGHSPWKFRDLTAETGVSPAQGHSPLACMAIKGNPQVYYLGLDNSLHELFWDGVNKWHDRNLTVLASANSPVKPAAARSPLACALLGDISRAFYLGNDLSVHQMISGPGAPADLNLTVVTSAQPAAGLSPLTAVVDANILHVIYNASNGLAEFISPTP